MNWNDCCELSQAINTSAWGPVHLEMSMLKSMIVNKDFQSRNLNVWQHRRQPIRSHLKKSMLVNMDVNIDLTCNPDLSRNHTSLRRLPHETEQYQEAASGLVPWGWHTVGYFITKSDIILSIPNNFKSCSACCFFFCFFFHFSHECPKRDQLVVVCIYCNGCYIGFLPFHITPAMQM